MNDKSQYGASDTPDGITGIPSGLRQLDNITGGFQPGTLILVAAKSAMGKSSFGTKLVRKCAERTNDGKSASLLFSIEMTGEEQHLRIVCEAASVDAMSIRRGDTSARASMLGAARYVATLPIFIDDNSSVTPQDLRARALLQDARTPLGLIVIDNLHLIRPPRTMSQNTIAESLKALGKELNIPIVALTHLNRFQEDRPNRRPGLSDLPGDLEQSADVVIFIHRDDYDDKHSSNKGITELIVAKHRGGETSTAYARWIPTLTRFQDLTDEELEDIDTSRSARRGST